MSLEPQGFFGQLKSELETQIDARLSLLQLNAAEKTARIISAFMLLMLAGILFFLVMLFLSLMGAFYFAEVTDSLFLGFAIIAGIYFVLFIFIILLGRKKIRTMIANNVIKMIFDQTADEENPT